MADVRAEILAASRSRTGWLEGTMQTSENQPFVSKVKSTFEEKPMDKEEKHSNNAAKSEAVRKLGSKVSSIANLFQSFSPHRSDYGSKTSNTQPSLKAVCKKNEQEVLNTCDQSNSSNEITEVVSTAGSESHLKRFNTARAIFERLEVKNKKSEAVCSVRSQDIPTCSALCSLSNTNIAKYAYAQSSKSLSQTLPSPSNITPTGDLNYMPFHQGNLEQQCFEKFTDHRKSLEIKTDDNGDVLSPGPISPRLIKYMTDDMSGMKNDYCDTEEKPAVEPRTTSLCDSRTLVSNNFNPNTQFTNNLKMQLDHDSNANKTLARPSIDLNMDKFCSQAHEKITQKELDNVMPIYAQVVKKRSSSITENSDRNSSKPDWVPEYNASDEVDCYAVLPRKLAHDLPADVRTSASQLKNGLQQNNMLGVDVREDEKSDSGISSAIIDSEYENEELLRVTEDSIELVCHGQKDCYTSVKNYKDPKSSIPVKPSPYSSRNFDANNSQNNQTDRNSVSSQAVVHYSQDSDSLDTSWENIRLASSEVWSKKTSSDNLTDLEDSENGSLCGTSNSLRDSAGETLAEFECREHELFFVEAVLGREGQGSVNEPFPSLRHCGDSETNMEFMTREEAERFLSTSTREALRAEEDARDVTLLLSRQSISGSDQSESWSAPPSVTEDVEDDELSTGESTCAILFPPGTNVLYEDANYHILPDGHFVTEIPGIEEDSEDDEMFSPVPPHKNTKVRFNFDPIKVYSTFAVEDYDRRNDDVDPVAASAEYELEKRIEKMDVFPVDLMKGPEGLGLSIIGMGVGADAGLEKLGIFVKSITESGAAHKDGRIEVNDQIIEVDGKSLVGVTQAYAASVLRNTSGLVKFLIGRENDNENSEIAQLISQSLQADKEQQKPFAQQSSGHKEFQLPLPHREEDQRLDSGDSSHVSQGSTPEEGEDAPTVEVFDLTSGSSGSLSPDTDMETLRTKLKEVQYRNAVAEADLRQAKEKLIAMEKMEAERQKMLKKIDCIQHQMSEREIALQATKQQMEEYKMKVTSAQHQLHDLEKKYSKAKKIIKEFQKREKDYLQQEEFHIQQLQEKDQEYNALVKVLKDRVILLEHTLTEAQKSAGLPLQLPYDMHQLTPQMKKRNQIQAGSKLTLKQIEVDVSDGDISDCDIGKHDLSPDAASEDSDKRSTVERKIPKEEQFCQSQPLPDLLEASSAKTHCENNVRSSSLPNCDYNKNESVDNTEVSNGHEIQNSTVTNIKESRGAVLDNGLTTIEQHAQSKALSFAEEIKVAVLEWHTKGKPDDEHFIGNFQESENNEQLFSQNRQIEKCDYPSHAVDEHHAVPPSYQHATGENFGFSHIPSSPHSIVKDNDSLPSPPATPPVEIPPKKRNLVQTDPNRLSSNSGESIESVKKDTRVTFPAAGSKIQRPVAIPPRVPERSSSRDRRPHHWQGRPLHLWTTSQVGQWLMALGLEQYIKHFQEHDVTGQHLLNMDSTKLKTIGVQSSNDRSTIKKKVKEMKAQLEKERKAHEKEQKAREKQQKKAEKAKKK